MIVTNYVLIVLWCLLTLGTSSLSNQNTKNVNEVNKKNFGALNSQKTEKYIITSILFDPFLKLKEDEDATGNEAFEGYVKDLADILADKLGFEYELNLVKDSRYGTMDLSDGQWNGMIGELIRNEAHIAIAPLTITSQRQKVIDFSIPFMTTGISVMIKRPSLIDDHNFAFLTPFTKELWISIMFSCIGVAIVFFIVKKFSSYNKEGNETSFQQMNVKGPLNNKIFNALRSILQQQNETRNRSISTKIIVSVFCFFVIILLASYTANLSLFLRGKSSSSPIQKVENLLKQSHVQYGLIKGGSTQHFFKSSNSPVYSQMWNRMISREDSFVANSKEGIERVRSSDGNFAFLLEGVVNDYANELQPCDTIRLGPNLNSVGYGLAVAKGQPLLKERIDDALINLGNDGTLAEIQNKWWSRGSHCEQNSRLIKDLQPISFCKVAGLFYIPISGMILALIISIGEYCLKSMQENSETKGELL